MKGKGPMDDSGPFFLIGKILCLKATPDSGKQREQS